jgi:DNA-binding transcriptional ArsR family regulator
MNEAQDGVDRPPIPEVPPEVLRILAELDNPSRLPILLALEQRPCTARELEEALGLGPDRLQFALKLLRRSGLVTVVDRRKTTRNLVANVYDTPLKGWAGILKAVAAVAASGRRE